MESSLLRENKQGLYMESGILFLNLHFNLQNDKISVKTIILSYTVYTSYPTQLSCLLFTKHFIIFTNYTFCITNIIFLHIFYLFQISKKIILKEQKENLPSIFGASCSLNQLYFQLWSLFYIIQPH